MFTKCIYCGKKVDIETYGPCRIREIMKEKQVCFNCAFWIEKLEMRNEDTFIVKGVHYMGHLIDKTQPHGMLGFGGHDFYIKYNNGKVSHYNNTWCQGNVPKNGPLAEHFEDNAVIITKEEFEKLNK